MKAKLLLIRNQLKMGHRLSFAEAMLLQRVIDAFVYQAGNSPVIPDGWIPVSERMPEMGEKQRYVLAADFKNNYWPNIPNTQVGVYGDWFDDGNPTWDDGDGEDLHLKEVTHWMPLPAAPQEVKGEHQIRDEMDMGARITSHRFKV